MMIPDDVGRVAFHGDAELKRTLLERLEWYETEGDVKLKMAMLQEKWHMRAQNGFVLNPYPKVARAEDTVGLRISGDIATLYALGDIKQSNLALLTNLPESRIYIIRHSVNGAFNKLLGVPPTLVCLVKAVSYGLPPERETSWLRQFWAAVPVGASLWQVPMRLVLWALSAPSYGILGLHDAAEQADEDDRGIKAVRDVLGLYERWLAGGRAGRQLWFSFVNPAEADVKNSRRQGDDGEYAYDLPASVRFCLRAAAGAARTADVEEEIVPPRLRGRLHVSSPAIAWTRLALPLIKRACTLWRRASLPATGMRLVRVCCSTSWQTAQARIGPIGKRK